MSDIFRANYRDSEVLHVGRPYDGGTDVVFVDASGIKWLIQVRRRARGKKAEGFATLQSLLGTLVLEDQRHGIIVSTADSFSHRARQAQRVARKRGYVVELYDKSVLDRMIGALLPDIPWHRLATHPALTSVRGIWRYFSEPEVNDLLRLSDG